MQRSFPAAVAAAFLAATLLLSPLLVVAPRAACAADAPQRISVTAPFEPLPGHGAPIIRVRFANGVVGRFMIDTGASYCVMTRGMAKRLGLSATTASENGNVIHMGSDHGHASEVVTAPSLFLGKFELTDLQFVLVNDDDFFRFGDEKVDGLLGNQLWENNALLIDFPRRTLTLIVPGGLSDDELAALRMENAPGVHRIVLVPDIDPDRGQNFHEYSVRLTLRNGDKVATESVYVDTGAGSTSIGQHAADKLELAAVGRREASTMGDGSVFGSIARVSSLTVGDDLQLPNFLIEYPGRTGGHEIPPLMGEDVLSYCVVLWDWPKKTLYLRPALPPLLPRPADAPPTPSDHIDAGRLRADAAHLPAITYAGSLAALPSATSAGEGDLAEESGETPGERADSLLHAMKNDPSDARRWNRIGDLLWDAHNRDKAREAYARSVLLYQERIEKAKPDDVTLRAEYAYALCDADQDADAEKVARALVDAAPKDAAALDALGHVLHRRSMQVLTGSNRSVDVSPEDLTEFRALVDRLRANPPTDDQKRQAQDLSKQAADCYDRAVKLDGKSEKVYARRSEFRSDDGLGLRSILDALRGADVNPFAYVYTDDALDDLKKAADLAPQNVGLVTETALEAAYAPVFRNEHGFDFRTGKFWDSLPGDIRKTVDRQRDRLNDLGGDETDPKRASAALEALGRIDYDIVQDFPAAEKDLRRSLLLNPRSGYAAQTLAELMAEDRRYDDIATFFGEAAAKEGGATAPLLHLWLGIACARLDKWDDAQTHFDAALKGAPNSFQTNLLCAMTLLERSDDDTAARLARAKTCLDRAEKALGAQPRGGNLERYRHARAIFLALSGQPDRARDVALADLADDRRDTTARDIVAAVTP